MSEHTIADRLSIADRLKGSELGWYVDHNGYPYPPNMWPKPNAPSWVGTCDCGTGCPEPVPAEYMEPIPDNILYPPQDPGQFDRQV